MDMYDRIRNRRKELKMTQDELAKLTGYNDRSSIAKIEAKKADLSQSKIIAFAKALNVTTSYLMDGEEEVKKYSGNSIIGEKVKVRRKELGLTLKDVAQELGVSESLISRYESNDVKNMGIDKITPLAKVLKCSPAYLMGWEEKSKQEESNVAYIYDESDFLMIPLYETISAGYGNCQEEFIEMIAVPGLKPNGTTYFAVKVRGNSMEPKIPNGSTIIIKKDITIENGEIGAFNLNDENLVKQKKYIKEKLILHSFNLAFDDKVVNEFDDFREYGKVVKVMVDL